MSDKSCGTCLYWSPWFHRAIPASFRGTGCCVDAKLDLPASWSTNSPMLATDGGDCIGWEPKEEPEKPEPYGRQSDLRPGFYEDDVP